MSSPVTQEEMADLLIARAHSLAKDSITPDEDKLRILQGIHDLLYKPGGGDITQEEWDEQELLWFAHVGDINRAFNIRMVEMYSEAERFAAREPDKVTPELAKQLYWWRHEGGREEVFSELPIEQRQALEAEERQRDV